MKSLNRFLIIFTIIFSVLAFGAWRFIQSKYVSTILSEYINNNLIGKNDIKLSFSRVSGGFFPPRTILENVSLKMQDNVEVQIKDISAAFSLISLFSSDIRFSTVELSDGFITLDHLEKSEKNDTQVSIFKSLQSTVNKIPFQIGRIEVSNTDLYIKQNGINIPLKHIALSPYEQSFDVLLEIDNFKWNDVLVDNIFLDAEIVEENIRVRNGYVFIKDSKISGSGKYEFHTRKIHSNLEYKLNFNSIRNIASSYGVDIEGLIQGKVDITGSLTKNDIYINGSLDGHGISSEYANVDEFQSFFSYHNSKLTLRKTRGKVNLGKFESITDIILNLDKIKVINNELRVKTDNLHLNDILYFLGDDFKLLKGRVSGNVNLLMNDGGDVIIHSSESDNFSIANLALKPDRSDILNVQSIIAKKLEINAGEEFRITLDAKTNDSDLKIKGSVINNDVDFSLDAKNLEIKDLGGEISQIVSGQGDLNVEVNGKDDVTIYLKSNNINNFDVYGFNFSKESQIEARYSINKSIINIDKVTNKKDGNVSINGVVDINNEDLKLKLNVEDLDIQRLPSKIKPIWNDVRPYVSPLGGLFNGEILLSGSFENLVTDLSLSSKKVSIWEEPLDNVTVEMSVDKSSIQVSNVFMKKNISSISGDFIYNFKRGFDEISLLSTPIKLNDFYRYRDLGLGYNGFFSINMRAKRDRTLKGKGSAYFTKTKLSNVDIGKSEMEFSFTDNSFTFDANIFNKDISTSGVLDFSNKYPIINIKYDVDMPDIRPALSFISEHNSYNNELNGFAQFSGKFIYDFNTDNSTDSRFNISQFHINNYGRDLTLQKPVVVTVENSNIESLDVKLSGSGGYYHLSGSGNLDTKFKIIQNIDINLSYLTLFTSEIERIIGNVKGLGTIEGNRKDYKVSHTFTTSDFGLKLKSIPLEVANASGVGAFRENRIFIHNLSGELGTGTFDLNGYIKANFPYPELALNGNYNNVGYQVESRSVINTDGKLNFTGRGFPYLVKGDVYVNGGLVENEFNDFKSTSEYNKSLNKYITQTKRGIPDLINLDINMNIKETVRVRNRLADLLVAGDLSINGQFNNPAIEGQLIIVPGLSKFKFRGNDFILSEGVVYFSRSENIDPISLNLAANSTIGQYDVEMGITGSIEDISINLESNPYLSKDNIFSLLTLGVTSDFSQSLDDSQRTNLTTIGIGTFLVDQLNINEGLDSALGLKLSVLPEFSESSDSPIEEATKSEQSVKTATKLQITKKVNDNIDLKFSNTFDSESNKQSINVDYSINEKLSIEGIFESEEDTNNKEGTDGSVGADIKYKWSF